MDVSKEAAKPKIVQLSSVHYVFDTRIFHKISKSLVKAGYSVDLIAQHNKDENVDGVNIIALPIAKRKIDRPLRIIPALFKRCLQYSPNTIFHFHDPELIPIGLVLKAFGYKVIYDVHEDVPKDILAKTWVQHQFRGLLSRLVSGFERFSIKIFDGTIVVTRAIGKRLDSERTILVQNFPIVPEKNSFEPLSEVHTEVKKCVLYVGDITRERGLIEDIEAVNKANKKNDIDFLLAGKFSPNSFKDTVSAQDGWKFVSYFGWISKNDFEKISKKCFAGIVTFHPIPNHMEAQPNKIFEYMLKGLPVIGSNFDLWKEIIHENNCGLLVDPLSPDSIADAILWLYENPIEARNMGENGRAVVRKKYNWANEREKLLTLYRELQQNDINQDLSK